MNAPTIASLKSFAKYLFWFLVAAAIDWMLANIGLLHLPDLWVPVIAAVLKGLATWVATYSKEAKE
jgi:3-methyladenine DNA glycosylase AlkD